MRGEGEGEGRGNAIDEKTLEQPEMGLDPTTARFILGYDIHNCKLTSSLSHCDTAYCSPSLSLSRCVWCRCMALHMAGMMAFSEFFSGKPSSHLPEALDILLASLMVCVCMYLYTVCT